MSVFETIEVPGATSYSVRFDRRSQTEHGCDYLVFYRDSSHREHFGRRHYWGSTFPGARSRPPLIINAPSFVLHFRSDSSCTEWGYRVHIHAHTNVAVSVHQPHWYACFRAASAARGSSGSRC